ncbi:MAG TPA: 3-oxoacyl-[acyl-carrier-protein] synthase III C-terminal domain-containing protein [Acidimicrobiales bacterium]|jgi:3-oxoacyl-[acyl-carrier-protein] synthase-3
MTPVGIAATATAFPPSTRPIADIFADEGVDLPGELAERLGIREVGVGSAGADLALAAATDALAAAGAAGRDVDVIVDYTILPQEYLVPVWNLGNRLQHELGATRAFTLGFSGGGATNFHVALRAATDLLRAGDGLRTALLFGADVAIPGNRVVERDEPVTVLGDGASAVVLRAGEEHDVVLGVELASDGAYHDVAHIPGGALAQLDHDHDEDLYRLRIDVDRLAAAPTGATVDRLTGLVLDRAGAGRDDVAHWVCPNLSAADQDGYRAAWGAAPAPACAANLAAHGHVQANDLVANLRAVVADGCDGGDLVLLASHGMGFTAGAALVRH